VLPESSSPVAATRCEPPTTLLHTTEKGAVPARPRNAPSRKKSTFVIVLEGSAV